MIHRRVLTAVLSVLLFAGAATWPAAVAQPTPDKPKPCSNHLTPPPPVNTSERPQQGGPAPGPLPIPAEPVGGPRMDGCPYVLPEGGTPTPKKITAASWIVADLTSGEVLAAKDPHARQRPASLIKVLLALVVLDELDLSAQVQATRLDARQECTCVGIRAWQRYNVGSLFTALLVRSGNDAAHTLGTALGSNQAAVRKMNALARDLGALDTRAATTSGLDGPGMTSSAYDQALIFRAALRRAEFAKAVSTRKMRFQWHRKKEPITLYNDNRLLRGPDAYQGFIGGKTGFTDNARHTYVGAAQRGDRVLAVVLMRAEQRPSPVAKQATRLLNYGFRLAAHGSEPVGELVAPGTVPEDPAEPATTAAPPDGDDIAAPAEQAPPPATDSSSDEGSAVAWVLGIGIVAAALAGGFLLRRKPRPRTNGDAGG